MPASASARACALAMVMRSARSLTVKSETSAAVTEMKMPKKTSAIRTTCPRAGSHRRERVVIALEVTQSERLRQMARRLPAALCRAGDDIYRENLGLRHVRVVVAESKRDDSVAELSRAGMPHAPSRRGHDAIGAHVASVECDVVVLSGHYGTTRVNRRQFEDQRSGVRAVACPGEIICREDSVSRKRRRPYPMKYGAARACRIAKRILIRIERVEGTKQV